MRPRADLLLFVVEAGAGEFRLGKQTVEVGERQAALYEPHALQHYRTAPGAGRWRFRWTHVVARPHWREAMRWGGPWPGLGVVTLDDATWDHANRALAEARDLLRSPVALGRALATCAVERALLWCASQDPAAGNVLDPRVAAAAARARQRLDRRCGVTEMADAAGLSASRLNVLFREQLGESPARYAERVRLEHAAVLLRSTGLAVKQVASEAGFFDTAHFSRRFSERFGESPSCYAAR